MYGEGDTHPTATKSLILVNPATLVFKPRKVVSMDASAAAAEVQFEVHGTSTLGKPAGAATTVALTGPGTSAAQSTALTSLSTERRA